MSSHTIINIQSVANGVTMQFVYTSLIVSIPIVETIKSQNSQECKTHAGTALCWPF